MELSKEKEYVFDAMETAGYAAGYEQFTFATLVYYLTFSAMSVTL